MFIAIRLTTLILPRLVFKVAGFLSPETLVTLPKIVVIISIP